jgi:DNA modification methylase
MPDNSVDSVVTDPPYGLKFMGKRWDVDVPSVEVWREVFRVLKPGGHLLSFGGTRTYHHMAMNVELAGFEIRDQVQWLYGSGFPKSMDISKQLDKMAGAEREVIGKLKTPGHFSKALDDGRDIEKRQAWIEKATGDVPITAPATDQAKKWQGWGTALKPANEPICLARKPLEKGLTVAENVLKHGTGGLNIDGSRIGSSECPHIERRNDKSLDGDVYGSGINGSKSLGTFAQGRWPANVVLDERAAEMLDEQSGVSVSRPHKNKAARASGKFNASVGEAFSPHNDSGGASRFFYCAKASKRERNAGLEGMAERVAGVMDGNSGRSGQRTAGDGVTPIETPRAQNHHPTVKPIRLMEYLIKLITPPGGRVLDPYAGSGSTGVACRKAGFDFVGIELDPDYCEIAKRRIEAV